LFLFHASALGFRCFLVALFCLYPACFCMEIITTALSAAFLAPESATRGLRVKHNERARVAPLDFTALERRISEASSNARFELRSAQSRDISKSCRPGCWTRGVALNPGMFIAPQGSICRLKNSREWPRAKPPAGPIQKWHCSVGNYLPGLLKSILYKL
jgi:hypothetical protein